MTGSKTRSAPDEAATGVLAALGAFGIWGLAPLYYKAVAAVPAPEVLAHRVFWAMVLLCLALALGGRGHQIRQELRDPQRLRFYPVTAALVSVNWLTFIWAIQNDRVLEASLGYYINPLVSVVLGVVFLSERLSMPQLVAVILAALGVINLVVGYGSLPWVSLTLAASFGCYGLLRKRAGIGAALGLGIETLLLAPVALGFLAYRAAQGAGAFGRVSFTLDLALMFAGVITAVPLVLFLQAARRLRLSTVGLMQYLAPTLQFLLAVVVFREPFGAAHLLTFVCIWAALALYSYDTVSAHRAAVRQRRRGTGVDLRTTK
ncbi:MAG: EamA family transporter RarD [Gammaproteobacteria bacterium]|nr:EamA family transporter RarD [Gammaproteobacteria bacterium]NIR84030.1 EamA family transporter RarD [Gammaproteobacteria bacterium]NIR89174.1 EamA family transporter RarD [Gammaproteobacteria bacterium]NIU04976.1 EamA family transporter RarD [Gammaproteobacteria bacterium]NIV52142.1 EamA family transporter RarD [Gammaproteobacteria bacterium]